MPDTYAQSHLPTTATNVEHTADMSAQNSKIYQSILQTHLFTPIAIETAGVWNSQAREFIKELGKRITAVTGEIKRQAISFSKFQWQFREATCCHWIFHHRHGLNTNNNSIIIVMIIIILITRDSVLKMSQ